MANEFYKKYVRKDSEEFTKRFVGAMLEEMEFTFNSYLEYFNLFEARAASIQERNSYLFNFFNFESSSKDSVAISSIKSGIRLLC